MSVAGPAPVSALKCHDRQWGPGELGFGYLIRQDWVVIMYLRHGETTRDPTSVMLELVGVSVFSQPDHSR